MCLININEQLITNNKHWMKRIRLQKEAGDATRKSVIKYSTAVNANRSQLTVCCTLSQVCATSFPQQQLVLAPHLSRSANTAEKVGHLGGKVLFVSKYRYDKQNNWKTPNTPDTGKTNIVTDLTAVW